MAARIGDPHSCPLITLLIPHVGGPILGPGVPNILIDGRPAAAIGDLCFCVPGLLDVIVTGAMTVLVAGRPLARPDDKTLHGGKILKGSSSVKAGG